MDELREVVEYLSKKVKEFEKSEDYYFALMALAKLLYAKLDLYFLENFGKIPSNHEERFEMVREYLGKDVEALLKRFFAIYRETYSRMITKMDYMEAKLIAFQILSRIG